jgi:hypothetical protein
LKRPAVDATFEAGPRSPAAASAEKVFFAARPMRLTTPERFLRWFFYFSFAEFSENS